MAAEALEQSMLESKDKEQLLAIAQALGIKTTSRAAKATLIDKILETTGGGSPSPTNGRAPKVAKEAVAPPATVDETAVVDVAEPAAESQPSAEAPFGTVPSDTAIDAAIAAVASLDAPIDADVEVVLGPDGEPLADWEIALIKSGEVQVTDLAVSPAAAKTSPSPTASSDGDDGETEGDAESRNSRRRRRRRNKGRVDGPQGGDQERFDRPERVDDSVLRSTWSRSRSPAISTCATRVTASCASPAICPVATTPTSPSS